MPISVVCGCGKQYRVASAHAGRRVACKACGTTIRIPTPKPVPLPPVTVPMQEEDGFAPLDLAAGEAERFTPAPALAPRPAGRTMWSPATVTRSPGRVAPADPYVRFAGEEAIDALMPVAIVALFLVTGVVWGHRYLTSANVGDAAGSGNVVAHVVGFVFGREVLFPAILYGLIRLGVGAAAMALGFTPRPTPSSGPCWPPAAWPGWSS